MAYIHSSSNSSSSSFSNDGTSDGDRSSSPPPPAFRGKTARRQNQRSPPPPQPAGFDELLQPLTPPSAQCQRQREAATASFPLRGKTAAPLKDAEKTPPVKARRQLKFDSMAKPSQGVAGGKKKKKSSSSSTAAATKKTPKRGANGKFLPSARKSSAAAPKKKKKPAAKKSGSLAAKTGFAYVKIDLASGRVIQVNKPAKKKKKATT